MSNMRVAAAGVSTALLLIGAVSAAALGASKNEPPSWGSSNGARAGESVADGTIAYVNPAGTELTLTNGTRLVVPTSGSVHVLHTQLAPPRPIKAWYHRDQGENVVSVVIVQAIHPGNGG